MAANPSSNPNPMRTQEPEPEPEPEATLSPTLTPHAYQPYSNPIGGHPTGAAPPPPPPPQHLNDAQALICISYAHVTVLVGLQLYRTDRWHCPYTLPSLRAGADGLGLPAVAQPREPLLVRRSSDHTLTTESDDTVVRFSVPHNMCSICAAPCAPHSPPWRACASLCSISRTKAPPVEARPCGL